MMQAPLPPMPRWIIQYHPTPTPAGLRFTLACLLPIAATIAVQEEAHGERWPGSRRWDVQEGVTPGTVQICFTTATADGWGVSRSVPASVWSRWVEDVGDDAAGELRISQCGVDELAELYHEIRRRAAALVAA